MALEILSPPSILSMQSGALTLFLCRIYKEKLGYIISIGKFYDREWLQARNREQTSKLLGVFRNMIVVITLSPISYLHVKQHDEYYICLKFVGNYNKN